jgi:exosortase/archaeosortase family protein
MDQEKPASWPDKTRTFYRKIMRKDAPRRKSPEDSIWHRIFPDSELSDRDIYIMNLTLSFLALVIVVFIADLGARMLYEDSNSLRPMQEFEAWAVVTVQREVFGIEVEQYNGTFLDYDSNQEYHGYTLDKDEKVGGVLWEITSTCSGLHEMVFLAVLIAGFPGVALRKRLPWAGIMAGVVFVENLMRIGILFFLAWMVGRDFEQKFHYDFWHYGQYLIIMGLFLAWFYFVAWSDIDRNMEAREKDKEKEEGGEEERESEEEEG